LSDAPKSLGNANYDTTLNGTACKGTKGILYDTTSRE